MVEVVDMVEGVEEVMDGVVEKVVEVAEKVVEEVVEVEEPDQRRYSVWTF